MRVSFCNYLTDNWIHNIVPIILSLIRMFFFSFVYVLRRPVVKTRSKCLGQITRVENYKIHIIDFFRNTLTGVLTHVAFT